MSSNISITINIPEPQWTCLDDIVRSCLDKNLPTNYFGREAGWLGRDPSQLFVAIFGIYIFWLKLSQYIYLSFWLKLKRSHPPNPGLQQAWWRGREFSQGMIKTSEGVLSELAFLVTIRFFFSWLNLPADACSFVVICRSESIGLSKPD